ncbi:MAG: hypothetical protein SGPRY_012831, partial [Prymnesium sp.]
MGADLFGSFGEATCAALLVGASSEAIVKAGWSALTFPLTISAAGILVCLLTSFVATHLKTVIIYGLALGYKSAILPVMILAAIVYASHTLAGMYGIALSALGMLGTLATCLTIDVYGPVRQKTDALDAAGNTTAAIGKGFAIGSASLVGLALFGAFVT